MKKTSFLMGVFALMLLMQACFKEGETTDERKAKENDEQIRLHLETKNITAERTADGLYIAKTVENPNGRQPETGDQVYVHYEGKLLSNGTVFDKSDTVNNKPLIYGLNNNAIIYGFNQGVSLMRKGERATIFVPSYLAYGNAAYDKIPAYSVLQFDLYLEDVLSEDEALRRYIREKNIKNPVARTTGLYFALTDTVTSGATPKSGERVSVTYKGYFLNGVEFDKSVANEPYIFTIGSQGAIKGFEEGITLMKVGEKATLMMPSSLAYGTNGSRSIPPYTPLIFEVTLLEIK